MRGSSNQMNRNSNIIVLGTLLVSIAVTAPAIGDKPQENAPPQPIDAVSLELYGQYIGQSGKINASSIEAAIVLVADRSGDDQEFRELLRKDFAASQKADKQRYVLRKQLSLITAVLHRDGAARWQHESEKRTGLIGQRVIPSGKFLYRDSPLLADVIEFGRECHGSEIDDFAFAVRQAHHPQGKQFLLDVLHNPSQAENLLQAPGKQAADKAVGKWAEGVGGIGDEARFIAAVGLAELGVKDGVDWLIQHAKPNQFGIDGNVDSHPHVGIHTSSLRENCDAALHDLTGLPRKFEWGTPTWDEWWKKNAATFTPRSISLRP